MNSLNVDFLKGGKAMNERGGNEFQYGAWPIRYARVANWKNRSKLIILQEVISSHAEDSVRFCIQYSPIRYARVANWEKSL